MGVLFIDSGNRVSLPVMRKYSMHLAPIMERCLHSDDGVNPAHGVLQQIADVSILFLELELIGHPLIIAAAALLRIRADILPFCGCAAIFTTWLPCPGTTAPVTARLLHPGRTVPSTARLLHPGRTVPATARLLQPGRTVTVPPWLLQLFLQMQLFAFTDVTVLPSSFRRLLRSRTG